MREMGWSYDALMSTPAHIVDMVVDMMQAEGVAAKKQMTEMRRKR